MDIKKYKRVESTLIWFGIVLIFISLVMVYVGVSFMVNDIPTRNNDTNDIIGISVLCASWGVSISYNSIVWIIVKYWRSVKYYNFKQSTEEININKNMAR